LRIPLSFAKFAFFGGPTAAPSHSLHFDLWPIGQLGLSANRLVLWICNNSLFSASRCKFLDLQSRSRHARRRCWDATDCSRGHPSRNPSMPTIAIVDRPQWLRRTG